MPDVRPEDLDVATLALLAGAAATERLLDDVRRDGHPDLRAAHGYVFQHLIDRTPTVGELAEALEVTQQAASKSVAELESLGYVARAPDPDDQRVRRVRLTERGRAAVAAGRTARARLEERLAEAVSDDARSAARTALGALLDLSGGTDAVRSRRARPPAALRPP